VDRLHPNVADHEHVAVLQPQVRERRRAVAMHDHRNAELARELVRGGEVIRVRMRVDDVAKPQAATRQRALITVDLPDLRIDQRRDARVRTTDEIRLAAAGGDLLEDHETPPLE
jgi:hypothetical protein